MNIHEHQAKQLLGNYGVAVPKGIVVYTPAEAEAAFKELGVAVCAVKSQIHAGGRGKGKCYDHRDRSKLVMDGGVKIARSAAEARDYAFKMLGNVLVTKQTGPAGRVVKRVYIESGSNIARELYLSIVIDRTCGLPVIMASTEGGMDIEEVAASHPEKILKVHFDPREGLWPNQARRLTFFLGLSGDGFKSGVQFLMAIARAFSELDCSLAEINPLVVTKENQVIALDAKINFDDNALYRHKNIEELRDLNEEDPNEIEAGKHDLNYIQLDGEIGCLVNGAGLAMATMDVIKLYGRQPANFLDVGGGATQDKVTAAFKIILNDPKVKAILVNIFGGIMKCDVIAEGVIEAVKEVQLRVPLVVRLEGTNVDLGKKILEESGLAIESATTLSEAAAKAVAAVK
ncbi:MAG TPA: ADP-forming succinate--CoA ligase subunit beta [Planctomycetota bacterium]|nr:ADP-forming succinate--CoA ligase subunit beta [Planctomycetota bacterium]